MLDYEISAAGAAALLKEKGARLIDVREPWEFATARIEGSVPMPMGDVPARAHQELDPEERLVVVLPSWHPVDECEPCGFATRASSSAVRCAGHRCAGPPRAPRLAGTRARPANASGPVPPRSILSFV